MEFVPIRGIVHFWEHLISLSHLAEVFLRQRFYIGINEMIKFLKVALKNICKNREVGYFR